MHPLVTTALLGTGQQKLPPPATETPLHDLLATLPAEDQEKNLLLQAGTRALYRQAGYQPGHLQTIPEPAEPETQAVCSTKKGAALDKILRDPSAEVKESLLLEALQTVKQTNQILPATLLPAMLDFRTDDPQLHRLLAITSGKRGLWLSQFNPDWRWLAAELLTQQNTLPTDSETIWQTGSPHQRVALLTLMRRIDPAQALEKLQAVWSRERVEIRISFLKTLQTGLNKDDETFLETCLDDRNTRVRTTASTLLTALPDSDLTHRMQDRASKLLTFQHPDQLIFHFTSTLTPADERDGLLPPKKTDTVTQAGLLNQIISRVPPDFWERHFSTSSTALLQSASKTAWAWDLLVAWLNAALLYKTESWYQPLWEASHSQPTEHEPEQILDLKLHQDLAARLPGPLLETEILHYATSSQDWHQLLPLLHRPWSRRMAHTFVRLYEQTVEEVSESKNADYQSLYRWNEYMTLAALGWPSDSFDLLPGNFKKPEKSNYTITYMERYYRNFKRIITIRRSLYND